MHDLVVQQQKRNKAVCIVLASWGLSGLWLSLLLALHANIIIMGSSVTTETPPWGNEIQHCQLHKKKKEVTETSVFHNKCVSNNNYNRNDNILPCMLLCNNKNMCWSLSPKRGKQASQIIVISWAKAMLGESVSSIPWPLCRGEGPSWSSLAKMSSIMAA